MHDIVRDVALSISSKEKDVLYMKNAILDEWPHENDFERLNSYKIVIGEFNWFNMLKVEEFKIPDKYEEVKFLALNLKRGIDIHFEKWAKMSFKSVEYLLLGELNDVQDIFYELNVEGFPNLKHLSIVNNFDINYIINPRERFHSLSAFPKLESIWLYKLDKLEIICYNQLVETSFCNLKVIKIKTCMKLVNLFVFSMVRLLTALETIEVCDCDSLKEIVSKERKTHTISDGNIEFPQLRLLTLKYLPTFICLYNVDKIPGSAHSLQDQVFQQRNKDIVVDVEDMVTNYCLPLFNEKVSTPKLEWLELSSINIHKIWSDQCNHCFQNLLTLNVTDCGNLKYLLSFSMVGSLVNLQSLFVSECETMEDIFRPEDEEFHSEGKLEKWLNV
ncbi:disease resistance protein RPS2 [Vigna unguiculata]|uniref:Disease resistance protein RPS2 n=1 Tax=Vigna unguiculata TaxID=3917 RepID=A0A4D6MLU4_VIGUN|nr:disease resistance protein RPS2 [Vigna unguiculata]